MTRVLETRKDALGLIHRRRRTPAGRDYWTVELPESVFKASEVFITKRLAGWQRAEQTRERLAQATKMLAAGEKQEIVAATLGMTRSAVAQHASRRQREGVLSPGKRGPRFRRGAE